MSDGDGHTGERGCPDALHLWFPVSFSRRDILIFHVAAGVNISIKVQQ